MWLAIDTTGPACAAALARADGTILAARSEEIGRGHAERLMPLLGELLVEAQRGWSDLAAIACTRGPGSFTGLRVGLAAARGLALACAVPVRGVSVFDAFAAVETQGPFAVTLDARRGEVWWQAFDAPGRAAHGPRAALHSPACEALARTPRLIGSAASSIAGRTGASVSSNAASPPIEGVVRAAMAAGDAGPATPLYMRAPDAKPQRSQQTARA